MNTRPTVYPDFGPHTHRYVWVDDYGPSPIGMRNIRSLLGNWMRNDNNTRRVYVDWCGDYLYPCSEDIYASPRYALAMRKTRLNWRPKAL